MLLQAANTKQMKTVTQLSFADAPEKPARKLIEEATEVLIEALNDDKAKLALNLLTYYITSLLCGRRLILIH